MHNLLQQKPRYKNNYTAIEIKQMAKVTHTRRQAKIVLRK